jgi:hypothetical protein
MSQFSENASHNNNKNKNRLYLLLNNMPKIINLELINKIFFIFLYKSHTLYFPAEDLTLSQS